MLALLRKKLAEFDAGSGESRLILSAEQIADLVRLFLADTANEAKLMDRVDSDIKKIVELGFLRKLRGSEDRFEVRRILKSFVDAQWLGEFERRLADYKAHITGAAKRRRHEFVGQTVLAQSTAAQADAACPTLGVARESD